MLRHQENGPLPYEGATGVVGSTTDNRWLEPTTPSAPAKEAARHFVDGRSHPSLAKEGSLARPQRREFFARFRPPSPYNFRYAAFPDPVGFCRDCADGILDGNR